MGNYIAYDPPGTNDLAPFITDQSLAGILSDFSTDAEKVVAVNQAIDGAESEVDSYLGKAYTVPISSPPEIVLDITASLIAERLHQRCSSGVPRAVTDRAITARQVLRDLARGLSILDGVASAEVGTSGIGYIEVESEERIMSRTNLTFQ